MKIPRRIAVALVATALSLAGARASADEAAPAGEGFEQEYILDEAVAFFGEASEDLAKVIERAFEDQGKPNAYIKGEEAGGAFVFGLRYGKGVLHRQTGDSSPVYWKGPSIGFDWGGNVSKTFILVYELDDPGRLYQRFPGVEGSLYLVGGIGLTYNQSESIVLAPIRVGVGLRAGASPGYLHITQERSWVPF